jgi:hypothetical protein
LRTYIPIISNKLENLEEMEKFLDTYDHPKANQEDSNHLNISKTQNKIEAAMKSFPKNKSPVLMDSPLNSIRPLKKN